MRLAIYLPCKYNAKDEFQNHVIQELTKTFSGLTIIPNCHGMWLDPETNQMIHDSITIIEIYTEDDLEYHKSKVFFKVVSQIKKHYNQKCVAYAKNDNIHLYPLI